jgi:hypothetical protein
MRMKHWWTDTNRETEVLGEKHYSASVVDELMSMEHWWNYTDRGKRVLVQSHSLQHECHLDCPGIDPEPPQWMVDMWGRDIWHDQSMRSLSDTSTFTLYIKLSTLLLHYKNQPFNGTHVNNCCLLGYSEETQNSILWSQCTEVFRF